MALLSRAAPLRGSLPGHHRDGIVRFSGCSPTLRIYAAPAAELPAPVVRATLEGTRVFLSVPPLGWLGGYAPQYWCSEARDRRGLLGPGAGAVAWYRTIAKLQQCRSIRHSTKTLQQSPFGAAAKVCSKSLSSQGAARLLLPPRRQAGRQAPPPATNTIPNRQLPG